MSSEPIETLPSEPQGRKGVFTKRILDLMKNPESILKQQDVLFVDRYDGKDIVLFFHCPVANRKYKTTPEEYDLEEETRYRIYCKEKDWEKGRYDENNSVPVIEMKDGRQVECAILCLDDFHGSERIAIERGFDEIWEILEKERATISE